MQNDNAKFKNEFKKRLYSWVLKLIGFIDRLPKDSICSVLGKQLLRSATSILANYIEASSASSRKDFIVSTQEYRPACWADELRLETITPHQFCRQLKEGLALYGKMAIATAKRARE